jgi:hypothetical protein
MKTGVLFCSNLTFWDDFGTLRKKEGSKMATISKRGNLQWQAKIRRKGYPDQSKTFETKADAEFWARQVEGEMDRGVFVSRAEAERTTLYEALDRFIQEYIPRLADPYKETTRARAMQRRGISQRVLASLRSKDVADFIKEREAEGVSGNTIRLDLALLSRLFNVAHADWGMESWQIPSNAPQSRRLPRAENADWKTAKRRCFWTRQRRFFARLSTSPLKRP